MAAWNLMLLYYVAKCNSMQRERAVGVATRALWHYDRLALRHQGRLGSALSAVFATLRLGCRLPSKMAGFLPPCALRIACVPWAD